MLISILTFILEIILTLLYTVDKFIMQNGCP